MSKKKERKHNYVVGYPGRGQCVYGKDAPNGVCRWADPFTPHQARARHKTMLKSGARIFRLVDVTDELLGKAKARGAGK